MYIVCRTRALADCIVTLMTIRAVALICLIFRFSALAVQRQNFSLKSSFSNCLFILTEGRTSDSLAMLKKNKISILKVNKVMT